MGHRAQTRPRTHCSCAQALAGTVASNVLEHGTGAFEHRRRAVLKRPTAKNGGAYARKQGGGSHLASQRVRNECCRKDGRPRVRPTCRALAANVLHDGSEEVLSAFPQAPGSRERPTKAPGTVYGTVTEGEGVAHRPVTSAAPRVLLRKGESYRSGKGIRTRRSSRQT